MPEAEVINPPEVAHAMNPSKGDVDQEDIEIDNTKEEPKEEWTDILGSGDVKVKILKEGEPATRPQATDLCSIKLRGELEDGTVFEEHESLTVELNGSEVIQGLDLILAMLDIGQKVTAIVKARFGYGALGLPPKVPPNATLIYNIEMLKVDYAPELSSIPFEQRKSRALFKKDKGNWWYARGDSQKAIQCYRPALNLLNDSTPFVEENGSPTEMPENIFHDLTKLKLVIYNNLAAAQLMADAYDAALVSVDNVIQLEPHNIKALFRKGKILSAKGNTDEAIEAFSKVLNLEPENNAAKRELSSLKKIQAKERLQAKSLYTKMLGVKKEPEEKKSSLPVRVS